MKSEKANASDHARRSINVERDADVRHWARSFNASPDQVREAVRAVGHRPETVREYLRLREGRGG